MVTGPLSTEPDVTSQPLGATADTSLHPSDSAAPGYNKNLESATCGTHVKTSKTGAKCHSTQLLNF